MRLIFLYFLLGLTIGCSSSRHLTGSTEQVQTDKSKNDIHTEQSLQEEESSVTATTTEMAETGEEVTIRLEYDTTQPTDTITGRPPLKSETVTYKKAARDIRQQQVDTTCYKQQEQTLQQDNTQYDTQIIDTAQIKRRPPWTIGLLLVAVVILIIKYRAIWKRRNWNTPW